MIRIEPPCWSETLGSSFVNVGERGFWISDAVLEVWLRFLALHVENPSQPGTAAGKVRDEWLLASGVSFPGCVPTGLDEAVSTPEGAKAVRDAVTSLLDALQQGPSTISRDALNLIGMSGVFEADVSTSSLIEVAHAFSDLLDGRITTNAGDPPLMPGSPRPRGPKMH